jgi:hypothetical protein
MESDHGAEILHPYRFDQVGIEPGGGQRRAKEAGGGGIGAFATKWRCGSVPHGIGLSILNLAVLRWLSRRFDEVVESQ